MAARVFAGSKLPRSAFQLSSNYAQFPEHQGAVDRTLSLGHGFGFGPCLASMRLVVQSEAPFP
jgi:hypothetical protein